ncbi:MAG: nickel-dependent hydrogenase large subunit [Candidatus Micrarchaeota archaeon]|nr:nickel-dependent hydrogenase large subunit [Candidatus Micrarchaeota archaeon]
MHAENFDITLESISKIEGHAGLDISVRNGEVRNVRLKVSENLRFFKEAVRGKKFTSAHQLVSRICGTCSTAHLMGCIECIENIFGIERPPQAIVLKHLTMNGLQVRDHAMHLFFFCLPDVLGKDSVLDFKSDKEKEILHKALHVKEVGNAIGTIVAGRAVHPTIPTIGGFTKAPSPEDVKKLISMIKEERDSAVEFVEMFGEWDKELARKTKYVATKSTLYNFWEGQLCDSNGTCIPEFSFTDHLYKVVIPYSQAEGFLYKDETYMVGALARMNIGKETLHRDTRRDLGKYISKFPSNNIFHNNLAQAIEIVHALDHSLELLETTEFKEEKPPVIEPKEAGGTGIVEAPRGTLYYYLEFDSGGNVARADLVIPTAQNHIMMEKDAGLLVQKCLEHGIPREQIERELEMLIRAYDPCMSCATHFLQVNWK